MKKVYVNGKVLKTELLIRVKGLGVRD